MEIDKATNGERRQEYLTSREVAAWLGVSVRTVTNLRRRHVLPYIKVGRIVRFRRPAVESMLEVFTVESVLTKAR